MNDKDKGIYAKYQVRRVDGKDRKGGRHQHCALFVLDLTHDKHAIPAIKAYIESCRIDYPMLASDLTQILYGKEKS